MSKSGFVAKGMRLCWNLCPQIGHGLMQSRGLWTLTFWKAYRIDKKSSRIDLFWISSSEVFT